MSFMFFELAANKEVQNKARAEVLDIIQKHDGMLTYEAIQEMAYLTQVMNETLMIPTCWNFVQDRK
jgi:cytochrome P450 family 6